MHSTIVFSVGSNRTRGKLESEQLDCIRYIDYILRGDKVWLMRNNDFTDVDNTVSIVTIGLLSLSMNIVLYAFPYGGVCRPMLRCWPSHTL